MQALPLFPLATILFPGTRLALRIFEPRYLDMVSQCLRAEGAFGVCLISEGSETGAAAQPHLVGTEARIIDWDRHDDGLLGLTVLGERRFRIRETRVQADQLLVGEVDWLYEEAASLPAEYATLAELLRRLLQQFEPERAQAGESFSDANWVGWRLAEYLPLTLPQRQMLLEQCDPLQRLRTLTTLVRSTTAGE